MTTEVLGKLSFLEIPDVNGADVLLNLGGVPSMLAGISSARPVFGTPGRLFVDTTVNVVFRDTGTGWDAMTGVSAQSVLGTAGQIVATGNGPVNISIADNAILPGTSAIRLPSGSTAQRPPAPDVGSLRYNSTLRYVEYYQPNVWVRTIGLIEKDVSVTTFTASSENNLVNYVVPAGTIGVDGVIRLGIYGSIQNTSGSNRTYTVRVKYGATTMYQDATPNHANNTTLGFSMNLIFSANDSAGSQALNGDIRFGGTGAVTAGITGDLGSQAINSHAILNATSAVNSNADQNLIVSIRPSGTGTQIARRLYMIELL